MSALHLNSLEIRNFRGLSDLKIERLGRVNLLTGRNNVGKSSVLEALHLYANTGSSEIVRWILTSRDEYWARATPSESGRMDESQLSNSLRYLFFGRPSLDQYVPEIEIGQLQSDARRLSLQVRWYEVIESDSDGDEDVGPLRSFVPVRPDELASNPDALPFVQTNLGRTASLRTPLERFFRPATRMPLGSLRLKSQFVSAQGLDLQEVGQMWDAITLTSLESEVLECLRLLSQDVERISFVGDSGDRQRGRHALIKFTESDEPVPIRSLGEGTNRILGMTLSLVNAKDGILLIDEIESGLHYSVQPKLWSYLFRLASDLNVQIFAITHSLDCVRAFQSASVENPEVGMLIRLDKREREVTATLFDEPELEIAADYDVEVR